MLTPANAVFLPSGLFLQKQYFDKHSEVNIDLMNFLTMMRAMMNDDNNN